MDTTGVWGDVVVSSPAVVLTPDGRNNVYIEVGISMYKYTHIHTHRHTHKFRPMLIPTHARIRIQVLVHTYMAPRKSLARSNVSHVRIYCFLPVHGFAPAGGGGHTETTMASIRDSFNITCHCLGIRDTTST